jgi:hypothetical protein
VLGSFNAMTHELIRVTNDTYITAPTVCELLHKIAALGLGRPIVLVQPELESVWACRSHTEHRIVAF